MQFPSLDDTIVAVSTAWEAAPLGVVRLSGGRAFELARAVGGKPPADGQNQITAGTVEIGDELRLPAEWYWFHEGCSFTGQPVVEIHTVGNLAILRALGAALATHGARRALPGEFTSRAYLNGRLGEGEVDGVLGLIHAGDASAARRAARLARGGDRAVMQQIDAELTDLIALVEAGIDFVEEEGVRFISAPDVLRRIREIRKRLRSVREMDRGALTRARPHVALVGLPNAGKSTLFNALVGSQRAIVAPVVGTTRDVLSAEVRFGPYTVIVQDTAGLGAAAGEVELAAHVAAEKTADEADVVVWVHDCSTVWTAGEREAWGRLDPKRVIVVASKCDQPSAGPPRHPAGDAIEVSVVKGVGVELLKSAAAKVLEARGSSSDGILDGELSVVNESLGRAADLAANSTGGQELSSPELVALELREAWRRIEYVERGPLADVVLGRIFQLFCVGK